MESNPVARFNITFGPTVAVHTHPNLNFSIPTLLGIYKSQS